MFLKPLPKILQQVKQGLDLITQGVLDRALLNWTELAAQHPLVETSTQALDQWRGGREEGRE